MADPSERTWRCTVLRIWTAPPGHRWAALVLIAALLLSAFSCSRKEGAEPAEQMMKVALPELHAYFRVYPFEGELIRPQSLLVEKPCAVEFLPLAKGPFRPGVRLKTYLMAEGRTTLLHSSVPLFTQAENLPEKNVLQALNRTARIDLSPYQGKRIALKWVLEDRGAPLAGALGMLKISSTSGEERKSPHILFICSDTHRYDHAFGERGRKMMPALNRLRERSVIYHKAFSSASWTMPAITSVMTGLFAGYHRTGFRTASYPVADFEKGELPPVPPGQFVFDAGQQYRVLTNYPDPLETFTELLQAVGYTTAMVVSNPLYILSGLFADGQDMVASLGVVPGDRVNAAAFQMIKGRSRNRPLFLLVHYMDMHHWQPWYFEKLYPGLKPRKNRKKAEAAYEAAARDMDAFLGELLRQWSLELGMEESLIVFYSDHGEHVNDPGRDLMGHGNSMDEVLLHVPLLVHYPASSGPMAKEADQPVSLLDIPATVLDLLGIPLEGKGFQGRSLLSLDEKKDLPSRRFFADSQLYGDQMSSIREGPFKLVLNFDGKTGTLVDTDIPLTDAGEPGRAREDGPVMKRLRLAFEDYVQAARAKTEGLVSEHTVDQQEALKMLEELGYVK